MKSTKLNASIFSYKVAFYNAEFEDILSKIISCYNRMIIDNVCLSNDENKIRDILLVNYLKNNRIRQEVGLMNFLFDREVPEDTTIGRTDIKIQTANTFRDTRAYYIIECKRLDSVNTSGMTGLNAKYIQNGICRFIAQTYSTYYRTNGMIGFVVQQIDIHKNIGDINLLLNDSFKHANTTCQLCSQSISDDFEYSYYSKHILNNEEIVIYHLMLDFSGNIQ